MSSQNESSWRSCARRTAPSPQENPPRESPEPEDRAILREISGGDLRRFDAFVDRYKRSLLRYLALRVGDGHRAEDLCQEVFLRVFRSAGRHGYSGAGAVSTWLFTIASNCATDYLRSTRRKPIQFVELLAEEALPIEAIQDENPLEAVVRSERSNELSELVRLLEAPLREVVALRIYAEMTFREAAEVIDCPVSTVKSRMREAVDVIRRRAVQKRISHE